MSALQPLARLVASLLREDDRRVLLGEDVRSGGMLGLSRVAAEDPQLRTRLLGSPLTGVAHVAHAGGLALAGLRPIVLLSSATALLEAGATYVGATLIESRNQLREIVGHLVGLAAPPTRAAS